MRDDPGFDPRPQHHLTDDRPEGSRWTPYLVTLASTAFVAGSILLLIFLAIPELGPGECSGIGWGCRLGPAEAAGFALVIGWPFTLVPLIVVALIDLAGAPRRLLPWVGGALPVVAVAALIVLAAAS